ncbi:MAG: hypothetical protein HOP29_05425 [Phycisphaerales bacterium]|nr:hypothetical protein [Phycisphaerales bacterium]
MASLSKNTVGSVNVLKRLGAIRLREARILLNKQQFAGAIYLAGYSVECWLKVAICKALDLDELPETFASHELDVLLFHSGLQRRIQKRRSQQAMKAFQMVAGVWRMDRKNAIRYADPRVYNFQDAGEFLRVVNGRQGIVPWLRKQI